MTNQSLRPTLGPFMNVTCFQYLRLGAEDVAGVAPIIAAGRQRGHDVIKGLGMLGQTQDAAVIYDVLATALGVDGTRLCLLQSITAKANDGYEVRLSEGACTAGQSASEPVCAFTLGVFVGAISAITGRRMYGTETTCCAMGSPECIYEIQPIT